MRTGTEKALAALAGFAVTMGVSQSADGALVVYEGFQYSSVGDELQAVTSVDVAATGLAGAWSENLLNAQQMFLKSGSLTFSNLPTAGNHVGYLSNQGNDIFTRNLDAAAQTSLAGTGTANGTIYISFLFEKLQNNFGADHEGLALMNGVLPASRWDGSNNPGASGRHGFAIANADGLNGSDLQIIAYDGTTGTRVVGGNGLPITVVNGGGNTSTSNQQVAMIVAEVSFNTGTGGADVFKLYRVTDDGSLDAGDLVLIDSIEADVDESMLSTLNVTRQVNVNYDEIRITTTLDEALGVPEPTSVALMGLGGLVLARRRRA
ncbi:MAG: PEP-CTERM sorting domain-containing protein [Phycisphaeraceae bacterium]